MSAYALLTIKTPKLNIDSITILIAIFIGYLFVASFFSPLTSNIHFLSIVAFIFLYFAFKVTSSNYLRNIDVIILSVCSIQACYGLMQYFGVFPTYKAFCVIGSFDNPAGFAACLVAGFPFCFSVINKSGWRRYLGIISSTLITVAIILSGSRAGFIAVITVLCIYFGNRYYNTLKKYLKFVILFFALILLIGIGLFLLKKDSAIGRILIWKTSFEMVADKPLLGHERGSFLGNYMQYQAEYFEQNPESSYSMLAGNVTHPFNEYLLLTIEYGIVGLLLFLALVFAIIKYSKQISFFHLCLLSIGVFACFSYPLRYPFILVLIAYSLANTCSKDILIVRLSYFTKAVIVICLGTISYFIIKDIQYEQRWGKLVERSKFGNYEVLLYDYEELYSQWNGDPMFLYNYGAVLNRAEQYENSNKVFDECIKYFNDYDIQMLLADNYSKLQQYDKAEYHYNKASAMIPSKFMPLYKLMLLYESIGDKTKAIEKANIIIDKPVKVPSGTVTHIQTEAKKMCDLK